MAKSDLRFGLNSASRMLVPMVLAAIALLACHRDDDRTGSPSASEPTLVNPASSSDRKGAADASTPSGVAGAGERMRSDAPTSGGAPSTAAAGMPPVPHAGNSGAAAGSPASTMAAAGSTAMGMLGGKLMYTGELTKGRVIPQKYKCLMPRVGGNPGENKSPPLSWTGGPAQTQSFALIVYDITYMQFHWAVWDIPASVNALPEAMPMGYDVQEPKGAHQFTAIARATDKHMYYGPCSGGSGAGTYEFRLFALKAPKLSLSEMSDASAIQGAVDAATLEKVVWAGMPD